MDPMRTMDSFSLIIGVIAVGVGLYELITKSLVGRDAYRLTPEKTKKFLPYDVATYIIAGIALAMTGAGDYFPFAKSGWFVILSIGISMAVIIMNVVFTNRILGKPDTTKRL